MAYTLTSDFNIIFCLISIMSISFLNKRYIRCGLLYITTLITDTKLDNEIKYLASIYVWPPNLIPYMIMVTGYVTCHCLIYHVNQDYKGDDGNCSDINWKIKQCIHKVYINEYKRIKLMCCIVFIWDRRTFNRNYLKNSDSNMHRTIVIRLLSADTGKYVH